MNFSIRHLLGLIACIAVGIYGYPAMIKLTDSAPTPAVLGNEGYRGAMQTMQIGGGVIGLTFYFIIVFVIYQSRKKRS